MSKTCATQMVTLGVDLASQPKRTATCLVRWDRCSGRVEALSMGATDSDLHELFGGADKIGIDAPFGWPVPFTRAVAQYSASTVWPSAEVRELRCFSRDANWTHPKDKHCSPQP